MTGFFLVTVSTVGWPTTNWPMPSTEPEPSIGIRLCASPLTQVTLLPSMPASRAYVGKRLRTTEVGVSASFLPSRSFGVAMFLPSTVTIAAMVRCWIAATATKSFAWPLPSWRMPPVRSIGPNWACPPVMVWMTEPVPWPGLMSTSKPASLKKPLSFATQA